MERQQLLKTTERSVIFNNEKHCSPLREDASKMEDRSLNSRKLSLNDNNVCARVNRYETKSAFMTVLSDFFGKRSRSNASSSLFCDIIVSCFVVLNCILLMNSMNGLSVNAMPMEQHLSPYHMTPSARNIRHLPCISRKTKKEGVCMFAMDCRIANGTHLGTCIDRFYFGSCCQIPDYVDTINDNNIEDNTIFSKPIIQPIKDDALFNSLTPTIIAQTQRPTTIYKAPSPSSSIPITSSIHYITKKPQPAVSSTTVSSTNAATKYQATRKPTEAVEEKESQTEIGSRPNKVNSTAQTSPYTTTSYRMTTTLRPLSSRPIQKYENVTTSTVRSTVYINNQVYNASKPATGTKKPPTSYQTTTTELPIKLSTFQTVHSAGDSAIPSTQKPTTVNTFVTAKRPVSQKPDSQLPFGTRLPSSTLSPNKTTTATFIRPTTSQSDVTSKPTTIVLNTTRRPVKPTVPQTQIPERITEKQVTTTSTTTSRPTVQRPINSTLSNRRTTTSRPSTVFKRPTTAKPVSNTQKPTTIIYKPFSSSFKPTSSQKPLSSTTKLNQTRPAVSTRRPLPPSTVSTTQKPYQATATPTKYASTTTKNITNTIRYTTTEKPTNFTKRPSTQATKIETSPTPTQSKPTNPILFTTPKPIKLKPTNATSQTNRPTTNISQSNATTGSISSSTLTASTKRPPTTSNLSTKPIPQTTTQVTRKPTPKPTSKPSVTVQVARPTTPSTLANEVDAPLGLKPSSETKKPSSTTTTTEKIGLVTWTNYLEPVLSSTTQKDDGWSPATPLETWVLLSTLAPPAENVTGPTMKPSNTIPPSKKPILAAETTRPFTTVSSTTSKPNTTTANYASTAKTPTTMLTTSVSNVTMKPTEAENFTMSPVEQEFTTFMYVSGGSTEVANTTQESVKLNGTTVTEFSNATSSVLNISTTTMSMVQNATISSANVTGPLNATLSPEDAISTEKSTVSPIEIITSTGSPFAPADSLNMSDYTDVCGRRIWPEARIVGGARSSFGRWPWQISLRQWRTSTYLHKCGAALLNENWAITAAHCVDSVPPSDLLLRLGEHDLASEEEPYGFQERRVQIVASHPQFDPRTFEYDLALLRFYEPVTFQPNILPVCVPTDDDRFIGKTAYVTGWGRLYEDGPLPSVLQEVSVPVIENNVCENMYRKAGYIEHIPNIFICAGWQNGGFDSCEGDSGGPMVLQRPDKRFLLAGVISWGIGCAEPNQPGVYTRISQFRHWINQILQF